MIYLSGSVLAIENMPAAIQPITHLLRLGYLPVILRSMFLQAVGLEPFWPESLALTTWGGHPVAGCDAVFEAHCLIQRKGECHGCCETCDRGRRGRDSPGPCGFI